MSHKKSFKHYVHQLEDNGCTVTPLRKAVLEVLHQADQPLTAREVLDTILKSGISVHRATVYRDIDFCTQYGVVASYTFKGKPVLYYEIVSDHHHHFVCEVCGKVDLIYPDEVEDAIEIFEKQVLADSGYSITSHRLKFYGTCKQCKQ